MTKSLNANDPLFVWLKRWQMLIDFANEDFSVFELKNTEDLDSFQTNPTEESFQRITSSLLQQSRSPSLFNYRKKNKKYNISLLLNELINDLWFRHRGRTAGIWETRNTPPQVFYNSNTQNRRRITLLAPAPADILDVPYRSQAALEITKLLFGGRYHDESIPPQRASVVFTQVSIDLRRAAMPQVISQLEDNNTPYLYLRVTPKSGAISSVSSTQDTDIIPFDHVDMHDVEIEEIVKNKFLRKRSKPGVLFLDFLDFYDWLHTGPNVWLPPFEPLLETIANNFLKKSNARIVFILNSDPYAFQKNWTTFLPIYRQLKIEQPNISAIGMVPQYMGEGQAARRLDFNPTDMKLIATRVPLLLPIILQINDILTSKLKVKSLEHITKIIPDADILVATRDAEFNAANATEKELVPQAFTPESGHYHFVISTDEGRVYPPVVPGAPVDLDDAPQDSTLPESVFSSSPTLQNIPRGILRNREALMRYLITYRDRIAVEYAKANGKLGNNEFTFPNAETSFTLSDLVSALQAGRLISKKKAVNIQNSAATPLDYFFAKRELIEPEIAKIKSHPTLDNKRWKSLPINKSIFTRLSNDRIMLSKDYIRRVIKWGTWFLNDPEVSDRSIYNAFEILAMIPQADSELYKRVPEYIARNIEFAALYKHSRDPAGARGDIINTLVELLTYYHQLIKDGANISLSILNNLRDIRQIVEFNRDALSEDVRLPPLSVMPRKETELYFDKPLTVAVAKHIFNNSSTLQDIKLKDIHNHLRLMDLLYNLRDAIADELYGADGITKGYTNYDYTTLTEALIVGNKIERNVETLRNMAIGRDLYERSKILQNIEDSELTTGRKILSVLRDLRSHIIEEQGREYSLHNLVYAIIAGKRINNSLVSSFHRLIDTYEVLDNSPTLQNIPDEAANDDESLIRFLLTYRDRVAVENLKAQGKLGNDDFLFPDAHLHYSLGTLLNALRSVGLIDQARAHRLTSSAGGPLEYFLNYRSGIQAMVQATGSQQRDFKYMDWMTLENPREPNKPFSYAHLQNIIRWGYWFLNDSEVATRSLYTADELAFMVLGTSSSIFDEWSDDIAKKIVIAGLAAGEQPADSRRQVVDALQEILDYHEASDEELDAAGQDELKAVKKLVEWNKDALNYNPPPSSNPPLNTKNINFSPPSESSMPGTLAIPLNLTATTLTSTMLSGASTFMGIRYFNLPSTHTSLRMAVV